MKKEQPFAGNSHSLAGKAAMDLYGREDLNELALKLVPRYDPKRFDATALRLYLQKGSQIVTLYAVDKFKQEQNNYPKDKLPVKKFKLRISPEELLRHIKRFDLTLTNDVYDVQDMLVTNK